MCIVFWLEMLNERDTLENTGKLFKLMLHMWRVMGCLSGAEKEQECSVLKTFLNFYVTSYSRNVLFIWETSSLLETAVYYGVK